MSHTFRLALLASLLLASNVSASVSYRATGRATGISASPGLLIPASVVSEDAVFSLEYTVDETLSGAAGVFSNVQLFSGAVGDNIAFTGAGGSHTFQFIQQDPGDGASGNFLDVDFATRSIVLQGIASGLLSVNLMSLALPIVEDLPGNQFPVEAPTFRSDDTAAWSFGAVDLDGQSLFIQGVVDGLTLIDGPDNGMGGGPDDGMGGGPDDGMGGGPDDGMGGGPDDGMGGGPDDGMGGGPDDGMGGGTAGGAVPEPASVVVWCLLGLLGGYRYWRNQA